MALHWIIKRKKLYNRKQNESLRFANFNLFHFQHDEVYESLLPISGEIKTDRQLHTES